MSQTTTDYVDEVEVTIGAGQSLSPPVPLNGRTVLWIETPAGLTGGQLTFVAVDAGNADRVLSNASGAEVAVTIGAPGQRHSLMTEVAAQLAGHARLRLRAGTAASPAVQGSARVCRLGLRTVI